MDTKDLGVMLGGVAAVMGLAYARSKMSGSLSERYPEVQEEGDQLWVWKWKTGGGNTAYVPSREAAMRVASNMGYSRDIGGGRRTVTLEADPESFGATTYEEYVQAGYRHPEHLRAERAAEEAKWAAERSAMQLYSKMK